MVVRKFRTTTRHGAIEGKTQSQEVNFYSLDVIISVGYRVKSPQGTQFRTWATQRLKEYIVMKIKDIYTTSIDYNPADEKTIEFFKVVQNKLLWAISQQTAAELVYRRADAALSLMGMQSFDKKGEPAVRKSDVSIAKNYLAENEIKLLGLLVEQYLAFAETMALQQLPMYMNDWIARLDAIIQLNGRELLTNAGKISHQMALEKSALELGKYREMQRQIQREVSMKELEQDIQQLQKTAIKGMEAMKKG